MKKFAYLLKKRDKALRIFVQAREDLTKTIAKMSDEQDACNRRIDEAAMERDYLRFHYLAMSEQLTKITQVTGE